MMVAVHLFCICLFLTLRVTSKCDRLSHIAKSNSIFYNMLHYAMVIVWCNGMDGPSQCMQLIATTRKLSLVPIGLFPAIHSLSLGIEIGDELGYLKL